MAQLRAVIAREIHSSGVDTVHGGERSVWLQDFEAASSDLNAMPARLTDAQIIEKAQFASTVMARADGPICEAMFGSLAQTTSAAAMRTSRILSIISDSQVAIYGRLIVMGYRANLMQVPMKHWYAGTDLDSAFERATTKLPPDGQERFRWLRAHSNALTPTEQCEWLKMLYSAAAQLEPSDEARLLRGVTVRQRTGPSLFDSTTTHT